MLIVYDVKNRCPVGESPLGTTVPFSFEEIARLVEQTGQVRADEEITHIEVVSCGLGFVVAKKGGEE